ncbi:MAG: hypothetical protein KFF73_04550 [Cyclobacteriaceae bacterium]|nr:hypothetical protein [Cyclobacteriaceae bacterium]
MFPFGKLAGQDRTAEINLEFHEDGEIKLITATVIEVFGDSISEPVPELDLYFYVERTFKPLPIGDIFNTTDEEGKVTIEFPVDLPGDSLGNVIILARIQESDEFADTEVKQEIKWGVPLEIRDNENKRSLWAAGANAPIPLLILVNSLILIAWSIIFYLIFKLYRISRM